MEKKKPSKNLEDLSYRELQKLAKKHNIKANQKKEELLKELKKTEEEPSGQECKECGKSTNGMPFICKFCGEPFCEEHRLPENHNCPELKRGKWKKPKKNFLENKRKPEKKVSKKGKHKKKLGRKIIKGVVILSIVIISLYFLLSYTPTKHICISGYENGECSTPQVFVWNHPNSTNQVISKISGCPEQKISYSVEGEFNQEYWYKISFNNISGWVTSDYVHQTPCNIPESRESTNTTAQIKKEKQKPDINTSELEFQIHELVNEERIENELDPLEYDEKLAEIARNHSEEMASTHIFSHKNIMGEGPTERGLKANYPCRRDFGDYYTEGLVENIHKNWLCDLWQGTNYEPTTCASWKTQEEIAYEAVEGWMNSEGHRENILSTKVFKEGIGVAISQNGAVYTTQNFC
ncbi:MAG: CAP domain-containing protein [Candidatus Undinarchaeales archaeon]